MVLLTDYNLLIESIYSHRSECVLAHLQSGCFFETDLRGLFRGDEVGVDRRIKRHLSAPCIFPSVQSVIPAYARTTALSVCRDSCGGVYHDLETGKCISRISRSVYSNRVPTGITDLGGTCTHLASASDSNSPLVFLSTALGDINVIDLRVGVKGEFGHPVMSLCRCHSGAISCMYNFRGYSFSLVSGGYEDGKLNFFDLRFPYDHVKSPYVERPMPLRSFEMHLRNQTKYVDMDETDQQILKHMKLGRLTSMAVSHDERLIALANGQSEVVICSAHEDVRVLKMGFLSSKDDYATSVKFGPRDMELYCSTYDLLAGIERCKRYLPGAAAVDSDVPYPYPYNFVMWPMLNFMSNDWVTSSVEQFGYRDDFELVEDMHTSALFGASPGMVPSRGDADAIAQDTAEPNTEDAAEGKISRRSSIREDYYTELVPDEDDTAADNGCGFISPMDRLNVTRGRDAETKHRSFRSHRPGVLHPLIFTICNDYAVSAGGCEAGTATVDVWDPQSQQLICSASTPETRNIRFEHICSGDDGVVLLSGTFERSVDRIPLTSEDHGHINKCVCVMKPISREALAASSVSNIVNCSAI
ncbi:tRNA (guanine-N1)-methyltransferase, putative [Babesia ovata]|uniref:tRNA (Guanine-N1)-methyltransferase, putative n=1 Tax=Babesia ovata TaxID=189622 RepID=A0A2H6K8I9_9APIC|nr:tRNA (guanine-N1)-methyltransferase, putative [Babesia ovata]GBE59300.1 tRNA (guanine-N1)-methyltransferase, putative [Babesia ovata]